VTGFLDLLTSMTLNDLEPSQKGFLRNFSQYLDVAHISILNCDEMAGVIPRQLGYEIFSIKRRFQQSKSRSPRFTEPGAGGRQTRQPLLKSGYFIAIIWCSVKTIANRYRHAVYCYFLRSSAAAQNPRMNCDEKAGDRLTVCEEELL